MAGVSAGFRRGFIASGQRPDGNPTGFSTLALLVIGSGEIGHHFGLSDDMEAIEADAD
jgi:hypothetical protein